MARSRNQPESDAAGATKRARELWWPAGLIPLLAVVAFWPGLENGYVNWDDNDYIRYNPQVTSPGGLSDIWQSFDSPQYYPLTFTSFWFEYRLWGPFATGYHTTNLILHAINALLVFAVLREMGAGRPLAWLAAALFAVHPIQVASVSWLAQRKNTLSGFFALLTMLWYFRHARAQRPQSSGGAGLPARQPISGAGLRARQSDDARLHPGAWHYAAALLAFAAALLSKTAVVVLPLSLILAERVLLQSRLRRAVGRAAPMLAMGLVLGILTMFVEQADAPAGDSPLRRLLVAPAAIAFYAGKLLLPLRLLGLYPHWDVSAAAWQWWLPLIGFIAAAAAMWLLRRRLPAMTLWGLGHFALMLLPASGIVTFGYLEHSPVGDHFVYLACIGFFAAVIAAAAPPFQKLVPAGAAKAVYGAAAAACLVPLAAKTWFQTQVWRDGLTFWGHTLAHNPTSGLAHNNMGLTLAREGRIAEALEQFRLSLQYKPGFWMARVNMGIALRDLGRIGGSVEALRRMASDAPDSPAAHFNLGLSLEAAGDLDAAVAEYRRALDLDPRLSEAHRNLGLALVRLGRPGEAIGSLRSAVALDPNDIRAHGYLGMALGAQGDLRSALQHFQRALQLDPANSFVLTNLGLVLAHHGQFAEALEALQRAVAADGNDPVAALNLGSLLAQAGRLDEASEHFRRAVALEPDNGEALNNLGALLVQQERFDEAVGPLRDAVRVRPEHGNSHYLLGLALLRSGQVDGAITHLRRALELQPDDYEAAQRYGEALWRSGRADEAIRAYGRALSLAQQAGDSISAGAIQERLREIESGAAPTVDTPATQPAPAP